MKKLFILIYFLHYWLPRCIWTADIQNAYLQAPSSCKNYIICHCIGECWKGCFNPVGSLWRKDYRKGLQELFEGIHGTLQLCIVSSRPRCMDEASKEE